MYIMSNLSYSFQKFVNPNKKYIELVAVALILLQFAPFDSLGGVGSRLNSALQPVFNPIRIAMSYDIIKVFLFLVLLSSCCIQRDMNLFFILCIYFIIDKM